MKLLSDIPSLRLLAGRLLPRGRRHAPRIAITVPAPLLAAAPSRPAALQDGNLPASRQAA